MKKKHFSLKKTSFIIMGLISAFLIIFSLSYSLSTKFVPSNIEQTSLSQQNTIKSQADSASSSDSLNQLQIGGGIQNGSTLSNDPITSSDGSYIITTNSGIAKVSPFGTFLYSYSFTGLPANQYTGSFANYKSRQVVQNYLDPSLFYLLIYSPDVSIDTTTDKSTWANPGYVLTLKDNGTDFSLLNTTALLMPISTSKVLSLMIFSPTLVGPGTTDTDINNITTLGSSAPTFNGKWIAPTDPSKKAPGINYDKNVIDNLYINNLNNMVFIDGSIFIFGGNYLPNYWFWSFKFTENTNFSLVNAKFYLDVGVTWPSNAKYEAPNIIDPSNTLTYLKFHDGGQGKAGWDPNGQYSYPAFFVAGAKTVALNHYLNCKIVSTSYSVQALFVLPGFVYLQKDSRLQSAFLNVPYVIAKNAYYFYLSMDVTRANNIATDTTADRLFNESTFGINETSLDFSPTVNPDGYSNSLTNQVYGFDIQTIAPSSGNGSDAINALIFLRDTFSRIIYEINPISLLPSPVSIPKYDDPTLNLAKEYKVHITSKNKINQSYTTQILFNKNTWHLLTNIDGSSKVIGINLSGSYVPTQSSNTVIAPSQISLSIEQIKAPDNLQIFGLLPVSDNYIYSLNKDQTNNDSTVSLFKRNSINSPYILDDSYVYKPNLPDYADNTSIWGKVSIKDNNYLNNAGYFALTSAEIANDPKKLQNLINFIPAWPGQIANVSAPTDITDLTKLPITINIEYFNQKMYNNQSFNQSLGFPDPTLTGLSSNPPWVVPAAVGGSFGAAAIIIALGLGIGIPMSKHRKLQDKGFAQTLKKVDTLTAAVGSVYKKIATETAIIKKRPQMLKGSSNSTSFVATQQLVTNQMQFNNNGTTNVMTNKVQLMTNQIRPNLPTQQIMTRQMQSNKSVATAMTNPTQFMTNQIAANRQNTLAMTNQVQVNRPVAPPRPPVRRPAPPQRPN